MGKSFRGAVFDMGDADQRYDQFFDPERSPLLTPGYVSPKWRATGVEIEAAQAKLASDRSQRWVLLGADERAAALAGLGPLVERLGKRAKALAETAQRLLEGSGRAASKLLPFYDGGLLVHVEEAGEGSAERLTMRLVVVPGKPTFPLSGASVVIHTLNEEVPVRLTRANVEDYLVFFCEHVHGAEGGFYLIEQPTEEGLSFPDSLTHRNRDERLGRAARDQLPTVDRFETFPRAELAMPVTLVPAPDEREWGLLATVIHGSAAFRAAFVLRPNGEVEMVEDQLLEGCAFRPLVLHWKPKRTLALLAPPEP